VPRDRNPENKPLPRRWRLVHGAYYYQVPTGLESAWDNKKTFRLGKTLPEAYRVWAERIGQVQDAKTIGALLDRYLLQVIPGKSVNTQRHNKTAIKPVRAVFADMPLHDLRPKDIYQYVEKRGGGVGAKREIEILSHAFTKAVEWGYIDRHPFKGEIRLTGSKARTRYVEDWEIVECLSITSKRRAGSVFAAQAYIRLKLLTGQRLGDLLRITASDLKEDGIYIQPGKTEGTTGKRIIIKWSPALRAAVDRAIAVRPAISPFIFCNRRGEGYFDEETGRAGGWESLWRNFFKRVIAETKVTEHFTEHDLRAKSASDLETLEQAQKLLTHADAKVTQRVYRRKPELIDPAG
jgi:integrase